MTVSEGQQAKTVDPLASQRTELLGKLVAAQMALDKVIAELACNGASTTAADAQLSHLATLQLSVGSADAASLAAMKGEVASAVAQSRSIAEQAREQAEAASAGSALALADARFHARETITRVEDDLYGKRIFDPYLRFQSDEDRRAFEQREAENRRAIAAARAKGTPEGEAEALAIEHRQLLDMGAHGATDSPDFADRLNATSAAYQQQRDAMRQAGHDTRQTDAIIAADTRDFLKAKGIPEAKIDEAMRSGQTTSAIIAPYIGQPSTEQAAQPTSAEKSGVEQTAPDHLDAVSAALRAAGVTTTASTAQDGHGVDVAVATPDASVARA